MAVREQAPPALCCLEGVVDHAAGEFALEGVASAAPPPLSVRRVPIVRRPREKGRSESSMLV
jgi:hypothetical protein